jgi:hypothetical protein
MVLEPDDVVLGEILPHLHLDEDQGLRAGVLDAMRAAEREGDAVSR